MKKRFDLKESDYRSIVYISLPIREDETYNNIIAKAKKASFEVAKYRSLPLTPCLNCMGFYDGLTITDEFYESWKRLIEISDVVYVFDSINMTEQMEKELNYAKNLGKKIHSFGKVW